MNINGLDQKVEGHGTPRPEGSSGRDTTGYRVRGERVPSVTEVLELSGLSDIGRLIELVGQSTIDDAAHRGSMVHSFCELADLDDQFDLEGVPPHYRGYVASYLAYKAESGFEPIEIERTVVSSNYGFAGTLDRLGLLPTGEVVLLDLKTPATASPIWAYQTAGYQLAAEDMGIAVVNRRGALQLQRNGKYKWHAHPRPGDLHDFIAALRVAHIRLAHGLATLED